MNIFILQVKRATILLILAMYQPCSPGRKKTTPRQSRTSSEEVVSPLKESTRKASQKKRVPLTNPEADKTRQRHLSFSEKQISTPNPEGHDYIQTKDIECPEINKYLPDIMDRIKELQEKAEMCETYKNQVLDLNEMRSNPKQIQFWTGFPNYETMYSLFVFLEPRARNLKYWRGSTVNLVLVRTVKNNYISLCTN